MENNNTVVSQILTISDTSTPQGTRPWVDDLNHGNGSSTGNSGLLNIEVKDGQTGQLDNGEIIRVRTDDGLPATYTLSSKGVLGSTVIEISADDGGGASASLSIKVCTSQFIEFKYFTSSTEFITYTYYRHPENSQDIGNGDPENGGTRDGLYFAFESDYRDDGHDYPSSLFLENAEEYKILYINSFKYGSKVYYKDLTTLKLTELKDKLGNIITTTNIFIFPDTY